MEEPIEEIKINKPDSKEEKFESKEEELGKKWFKSLFTLTRQLGELIRPGMGDEFFLYYPFLGAILDYAKLKGKLSSLEVLKEEIYKKPPTNQSSARERAQQLVEMAPLERMKVLEIGGPFVQVLHLLGAEKAVCIDPAPWPYEPKKAGYQRILERFDFTNPREYFGGKYGGEENFDIVLTRGVLSIGSFLVEFRRGEGWTDEDIYQGMLGACAEVTQKGGLNIHAGDCVDQKDEFYNQINLKPVAQAISFNIATFVFEKE